VTTIRRTPSQTARQGLAVLMVSAVVVLRHETSTLRQSHNVRLIDLTFDVGYYVRVVTSAAKIGSDPMSGRNATWGQHDTVTFVFYTSTELQPIPVNQFSRTIAQKNKEKNSSCAILKFAGVLP